MKSRILSCFSIIFYSELLAKFSYGALIHGQPSPIPFNLPVPPDYCLEALNISDCGRPPTPVFTYYKPGSRCEIEFWRGCPTINKFADEVQCSHNCIARLSFSTEDVFIKSDEVDVDSNLEILKKSTGASVVVTSPAPDVIDPCKSDLNPPNCAKTENFTVYTYDATSKTCIEGIWFGCDTTNKFSDEKSCWNSCVKDATWKEKITALKADEVNDINEILSDMENSDEEEITETTTGKITEPPPEETTILSHKETTEVPHEETTEPQHENTHDETTEASHDETTEASHDETTEASHNETTEASHEETTEVPHEDTTVLITTEHVKEKSVDSDGQGSPEEVITT